MKQQLIKIFYPGWRLYKFLVLRPLYAIEETMVVWNLRNYKERSFQRKRPLPLDEGSRKILEELNRDGISITHIDEFFPNTTWFGELTDYADSLREQSKQNKTKPYWMDMWDVKNFFLDFSNPFLGFSLDPKIVALANAYIGMYTRLHSIGLSLTIPVKEGTPARQSQRWHRDIGNKRYFKMFLYLNDIEKDDGPFIYVKKSHPSGKWYKTFPAINPYTSKSGRVEDADLANAIPPDDIVYCTGKAGTLVFADTTGLHKGGYSTRNPRFASITTYFSLHSLAHQKYKKRLAYPPHFNNQIDDLLPQVQFAVKKM